MATATFSPMQMAIDFGVPAELQVDTGKMSDACFQDVLAQGCKYYVDAKLSHRKSAITKGTKTTEAREFTAEDAHKAIQDAIDEFYAPEWRAKVERAPRLSLEDQCWHDLLGAKFKAAGEALAKVGQPPILVKANTKTGREAVTVATLIAQYGSPEAAFRAVNEQFIRGLWASKGTEVTPERFATIEARSDEGWAKLRAEHAKELKARQRAAEKLVDAEVASL